MKHNLGIGVTVETDDAHRPVNVTIDHPTHPFTLTYLEACNLRDTLDVALIDDYAEAARMDAEVDGPSPARKAAATKRAAGTDRVAALKAAATRRNRKNS